ncbi:MAG: two pore domain potassium channel family protein, partial [Melioribacteraceae bacterium]|nr:two pore domain potassium channel family protein [Melioribacteraceae bacterium]
MNNSIFTHIKYGLFALLLIIIIGTLGYEYIEDEWSFLDSLYMTVISISTTGFKEVRVLSTEGRIFTIFIIISGVLALAYTGGKAAQIMIERQIFRRRKMHK